MPGEHPSSDLDRPATAALPHLLGVSSDGLLAAYTTYQHLHPHRPLTQALADAGDALRVCPQAAEAALGWLQIDPTRPIGRLRRTELVQLARAVHRFWQNRLAQG